jgi:mannose-6-phosphate isomerase-like protein (cupin superfamily)
MPGPFTHRKLTEVEDSAPKFGFEGIQEARFANDDLEVEHTGVSHHRLYPRKRQGFAHRHDEAEEVYVVISGSGRVKLDDEIVELEALDAIRVSPAVTRQFEAGGEGMEWVVFGPQHEGDGEAVEDWWTD